MSVSVLRGLARASRTLLALAVAALATAALITSMAYLNRYGTARERPTAIVQRRNLPVVKRTRRRQRQRPRRHPRQRRRRRTEALPALDLPSMVSVPLIAAPAGPEAATGASAPLVAKLPSARIPSAEMVDVPPRPIRRVPAVYPRSAETAGVEGVVHARVLVGADGFVQRVVILKAKPKGVFEGAARAALRQWQFSPAKLAGRALRVWVRQRLLFGLK